MARNDGAPNLDQGVQALDPGGEVAVIGQRRNSKCGQRTGKHSTDPRCLHNQIGGALSGQRHRQTRGCQPSRIIYEMRDRSGLEILMELVAMLRHQLG